MISVQRAADIDIALKRDLNVRSIELLAVKAHIDRIVDIFTLHRKFFLRYPKEKDVTETLLKRVNQGHEDELAAAKAKLDSIRAKANEQKEAPAIAPAN